jgi:hypothetical protein
MLMQSTGQSNQATFLACTRQGIFFLPLIFLLPWCFGLAGVQWTQPVADVLSFAGLPAVFGTFLPHPARLEAEQNGGMPHNLPRERSLLPMITSYPKVRLIASDIDGTLPRTVSGRYPPRCFEQVERLARHGVAFCAASGRQYPNLEKPFRAGVAGDVFHLRKRGPDRQG